MKLKKFEMATSAYEEIFSHFPNFRDLISNSSMKTTEENSQMLNNFSHHLLPENISLFFLVKNFCFALIESKKYEKAFKILNFFLQEDPYQVELLMLQSDVCLNLEKTNQVNEKKKN